MTANHVGGERKKTGRRTRVKKRQQKHKEVVRLCQRGKDRMKWQLLISSFDFFFLLIFFFSSGQFGKRCSVAAFTFPEQMGCTVFVRLTTGLFSSDSLTLHPRKSRRCSHAQFLTDIKLGLDLAGSSTATCCPPLLALLCRSSANGASRRNWSSRQHHYSLCCSGELLSGQNVA